jgi:hypothetical protein
MAATILVVPEKDSAEGYEQEIDTHNDGLAAAGFFPQYGPGTPNMDAGIEKDFSGNLIFKDPVAGGPHTLTELLAVGSGSMPIPTQIGQVLFSLDGLAFTSQLPLTAPNEPSVPGSAGWLVKMWAFYSWWGNKCLTLDTVNRR